MKNKYYLYHIHPVENDSLEVGYIGVCSDISKRRHRHFTKPVNSIMQCVVDSGQDVIFKILLISTKDYCLDIEQKLRPEPNLGWNVKSGGKACIFPANVKELMANKKIGNNNVGSGENHHFYGKTGENSVRFGTKGAASPNHIGIWSTPCGDFESMSLAGKANGVSKSTVHFRCKHPINFTDWYFTTKEE